MPVCMVLNCNGFTHTQGTVCFYHATFFNATELRDILPLKEETEEE